MEDKKQSSGLGGHISSPIKYDPTAPPISSQTESAKEAEKLRSELDDFKKKLVKKFPFTVSLSLLPAQSYKFFEEDEGLLPEEISKKPMHLMLIIPEEEFKNIPKKIKPEVVKLVQESKQNLWVHIKTPVDVWNYGLDSKYEMLESIGASMPLHDKGFLGALRVATIHKSLVLRKFEKYVASYVIAGSLVRGTADKDSDVDVFVIIDDTDVKKMPRVQLLEKLRTIIVYDFIREATALAGVKNQLNVQVYLLTDFWQSVKDAVPVIFTFIRDGVPMYDRGTFLPWKLLLQMGKIKPSPEAVDQFMKYGEQNDGLVKRRLMDAMIDIYWGVVTPMQALMMLAGHAPPAPKTIVQEVKELFVDKEKIMSMKELKTLEKAVNLYKDYEHGKLKEISGSEVDQLLKDANDFDKKLKELRKKIEARLIENTAKQLQSEVFEILKNIFGNKSEAELGVLFEKDLVKQGKLSPRFSQVLEEVSRLKQKVGKNLTQSELDRVRRDVTELISALVEYSQRKEMTKLQKDVLQIKYGADIAELAFTTKGIFLVTKERIRKFVSNKFADSSREELEAGFSKTMERIPLKVSHALLEALTYELGDFEISY